MTDILAGLNPAQRRAAEFGTERMPAELPRPLLIIAGAGTGKTRTLCHRVAQLMVSGADPRRLLLLTFTRRAAAEMTRRAVRIAGATGKGTGHLDWSGTFHAVGNRLLRLHAAAIGLDPSFTVLDRGDSADLIDVVRHELGFSKQATRFPQKGTCLAIYSHAVNAGAPVKATLDKAFPWCAAWEDELKQLFRSYVEAKQKLHVLDYDDLLLYWSHLMAVPEAAALVARRFDHVLVDEYQDTNALQSRILLGLKPDGRGLTVVGDDAQSIYAFRAATVRNILDFPAQFTPRAEVIALEENYRSTQPILDAANAVIAEGGEQFTKRLFSQRPSHLRPALVTAEDEQSQVDYIVERVLEAREAGVPLREQAVLMRTAHHSDLLELELARRNIPFVKFGGLKFLEAAHVKDVLCVLRWAENPRDDVAGFRVVQLLPGIGPAGARRILTRLAAAAHDIASLKPSEVPAAARADWPAMAALVSLLRQAQTEWKGQLGAVRRWYEPHLPRLHEAAPARAGDLEQLEHIANGFASREQFLTELTLDPPQGVGENAGDPMLDEDYLILSTIHSAKGQEWAHVHVLNVVDGCIPSDMATGTPEEIDEERRLLYVAMTRAKDQLHLVHTHRFYTRMRTGRDNHLYAPRSRFVTDAMLPLFERRMQGVQRPADLPGGTLAAALDVPALMRQMWS